MALQVKAHVALADFEAFLRQTENSEAIYEFILGEIVPVPSNTYVSKIAGLILTMLNLYLFKNDIGHVTGADGGYMIGGNVFAPDVAFLSSARQPELPRQGFNPIPPDLAIEVISDPKNIEEQTTLRRKIGIYLSAGVVVWVFNPFDRFAEVYQPGKAVIVIDENGTLDGGDVLPGFSLALKDLFPKA